jgi:hypothetical protein
MSDEATIDPGTTADVPVTPEPMNELALLKQRADLMGIKYHPNISAEKLKAKIEEKKEGIQGVNTEFAGEEAATIQAYEDVANGDTFTQGRRETPAQINMKKRQEALRLVRVRVTNMNPLKSNMKGEIYSVGNSQIGFIKKFVPFNAEAGWHVPQIILTHMQEKKFMTHYEVKIGNKKIKKNKLVPELAIEILPPLTAEELHDLKQRQLMAAAGSGQ